jgi:hypothetical protein
MNITRLYFNNLYILTAFKDTCYNLSWEHVTHMSTGPGRI